MSPAATAAASQAGLWEARFALPAEPLHLSLEQFASDEGKQAGPVDGSPALVDQEVGAVESAHLEVLGRRHRTSLDALLLAGLVALLHRATEREDVTVWFTPAAYRRGPVLLPLRVELTGATVFADLVADVTHWMVAAEEDADGLLRAAESLPAGGERVVFQGTRSVLPQETNAMLTFAVSVAAQRCSLQLRFSPATAGERSGATSLLRMLVNLLHAMDVEAATPVAELVLASAEEQATLLEAGRGPVREFGAFEAVHDMVLRVAGTTPGRIAVRCAGTEHSYAALAGRASAIATELVARGVGPGSRVALCLARTFDLPASMLAVLLTGAAYVPLDPLFPPDRIRGALEDCAAALLLTDGSAEAPVCLPELRVPAISLEFAEHFAPARVGPTDPAYIIYTSGSTGRPKGVVIGHGALHNLVHAQQETPGMTADDVVLSITTVTFDISVADFWVPLTCGAQLVLATQDETRSPAQLTSLLNRTGATLLETTPGFWRALIEQGWTTHAPGAANLRVLAGGESMPRDLADQLLERSPEVWNMYGPTECTVWVTATRVEAGTAAPLADHLMANCDVAVMDRTGNLVPPGITGELVVGGPQVGLGYWNRPELTADKFIPHPQGRGQLYRSGDLAQRMPDGRLRLLGRSDFQVKVRGYRIELGEIEHVLARHPAVREAVVVQQTLPAAAPGLQETKPLVAFLDLGDAFEETDPAKLREELNAALRRALPEYMVPAEIVPLAKLPRLFNTKVDRKALPQLRSRAPRVPMSEYVAPRDYLERQLVQLWQGAVGVERLSIQTGWFALRADSLTALRLITRVNRTYNLQLGLADLLTLSTVEQMAAFIREEHRPPAARSLVPLRTAGHKPPLFLLHGVGGNIVNFAGLSGHLLEDQPVYALQAQALLAGQPALLHMEDMAGHYVQEMQTVQPHGPYFLLGYSFGGTVVAEMARQLRATGETVSMLAMLDARTADYERAFEASMPRGVAGRRNLARFAGNTQTLTRGQRLRYVGDKLRTRAVRYLCVALGRMGLRTLPSFLKVAWDVNLAAFYRYRPQVSPGRLVLFRARYQDFAKGPRELGWAELFPDGVEVHEIESDHERMFLDPALGTLASELTAAMATAAKENVL